MKQLSLRIKKIYFDEILAGVKKIEYRAFNDFYLSRLTKRNKNGLVVEIIQYDTVKLYIGNEQNAPYLIIKCQKIEICQYQNYIPDGFNKGDVAFEIILGEIVETNQIK